MLEAREVQVTFGGLTALGGVSLTLEQKQVLGLIGPNGAGKTTLVNVLSGFQKPTKGAVLLNGQRIDGARPHRVARAGVARTFQAARLFKRLTVLENLEAATIGCGRRLSAARAKAYEILDWIGCLDRAHVPAGALSYGEERRVGIARAVAMEPHYALLDEPASGLNEEECEALMAIVRDLPRRFGCGVLLIEHNMTVVMGLCERIHVLDGGRSLAEGTPAEVMADPAVRRAYLGERQTAARVA